VRSTLVTRILLVSFIMSIQRKFPNVHWLATGATSTAYEVHPRIVLKVRQPGEEPQKQFQNEVKILRILFSQETPCPYLVQCFLFTDDCIFSEYMHGERSLLVERYQTGSHSVVFLLC
jgi:predicted Ser/Thr protein kinase